MNRIDVLYDIRKAKMNEAQEIMEFIKNNWSENHILATNGEFFEYEHIVNDNLDFIIAVKRESKLIVGILGILRASQNSDNLDIWAGLWKVIDGEIPLLGFEMYQRAPKIYNARSFSSIGDNPNTTVRLMKVLTKNKVVKMKHFYMLADKEEYFVAKVKKKYILANVEKNVNIEVSLIEKYDEIQNKEFLLFNPKQVPYKDDWYIKHRYFDHPINKYKVYSIKENQQIKAIMIGREQVYNGVSVLRIVDYIGDYTKFVDLRGFFIEMLDRYEYIDFYQYGFDEDALTKAGFVERKENDINIIPNYFSPFVQDNIDIWCNSTSQECVFFKGDGDQDRPN